MRTNDVPKHLRDRVAAANPRGAQVGNHTWRTMSEIKQLLAQYFPNPRRAQPPAKLTRAVRTGPDPDADLYRRAGW